MRYSGTLRSLSRDIIVAIIVSGIIWVITIFWNKCGWQCFIGSMIIGALLMFLLVMSLKSNSRGRGEEFR